MRVRPLIKYFTNLSDKRFRRSIDVLFDRVSAARFLLLQVDRVAPLRVLSSWPDGVRAFVAQDKPNGL